MSGSRIGGLKARDTNLKRNPNFYGEIGAMGGKISNPERPKGFAENKERARWAGALGGRRSTRTGVKNGEKRKDMYACDPQEAIAIDHGEDMWPVTVPEGTWHTFVPEPKKPWYKRFFR